MQRAGPLGTSLDTSRVKQTRWWEYVVRFVFGGLVTAAAGAIGMRWGPVVGGLFLAFPSILPASLTLVSRHSKLPLAAGADALGATLGSCGLFVFGLLLWAFAPSVPAWLLLLAASLVWLLVACGTWAAFQGWHRHRHHAILEEGALHARIGR